jgi:hypothetical protein
MTGAMDMEHQKQLQGGLVAELETRMMEEAEEEEREQAEEEGRMEARVRELQLHAEVMEEALISMTEDRDDVRLRLGEATEKLKMKTKVASVAKARLFTSEMRRMSAVQAHKSAVEKVVPPDIKKKEVMWLAGSAEGGHYTSDGAGRVQKQKDTNMLLGFVNKISERNVARAREMVSHIVENNTQFEPLQVKALSRVRGAWCVVRAYRL